MTSTNSLTDQQLAEIETRAAHLREYGTLTDEPLQEDLDRLTDIEVPALLDEVRRLRARTLTESEYSAAWHAVEGAAGEEGADPGTILHAVLDRLGITWTTDEQPAAETPDETAPWPTFTLERWDWTTSAWDTHATYGPNERGEGNAYFAVSSERASNTGPIRLLKNGVPVVADDPATFYADTGW